MARQKTAVVVPPETEGVNTQGAAEVMAEGRAAMRELAVVDEARMKRAREMAELVGYAGMLSPEVAESFVSSGIQRTAEGVWLMGAGLLMLKELTSHGEFMKRVEALGISPFIANSRMSAVAKLRKFSDVREFRNAVSKASHLLELATLDTDSLNLLVEGGSVGEVTLDKVDTMSVRQLREALREKDAELDVATEAREKLGKRIDKLEAERRRYNRLPPDQQLVEMQNRAATLMAEIRASICGGLRQACLEIGNHGEERGQHKVFLSGLVAQVQREITLLREEFGLLEVVEDGKPAWQRWAEEQEAKEAAAAATAKPKAKG